MQLLVSWAIVVISTLYGRGTDNCADGEDCESGESSRWIVSDSSAMNALGETVFVLTVAASFLISFDSYVNAKAQANPKSALFLVHNPRWLQSAGIRPPASPAPPSCHLRWQARWRQLRSCAGTLESIMWAYRTRVAPFGPHYHNTEHDLAERELREALINWREKLAAGAELNITTLRRNFPPRVFKHGQRPPPAVSLMQKCWHRFSLNRWWKSYNNARNTVRSGAGGGDESQGF